MRVAVYSDYFYPELGGIQDSLALTAVSLGARGHEVDLVVPGYSRADHDRIGAGRAEPDLGRNVRVRRRLSLPFPSSTQQSRAGLPSPFAWLGQRGRRPDVIHVHSFFGIGLEALLAGRMLGVPVIGTNHSTVAGLGPHLPVSVARATAFVLWFYNRCDLVTAPSRSVFADLGAARLHPPQRVVSNPIDTTRFAPVNEAARDALRERLGLTRPTVAYAGRLGAEKNLEPLLRAVALTAGCDLVLAGHGSHAPALQRLAQTLGIGDRVRFLGTLPAPALAELLQASDVFAMPSTSETQSMATLQAMACGLPVIGADSRALPELVTPELGLLAAAHDPAAWACAIATLLHAPELRHTLGGNGRARAESCSIAATTDAWEAIYRAAVESRKGAGDK